MIREVKLIFFFFDHIKGANSLKSMILSSDIFMQESWELTYLYLSISLISAKKDFIVLTGHMLLPESSLKL